MLLPFQHALLLFVIAAAGDQVQNEYMATGWDNVGLLGNRTQHSIDPTVTTQHGILNGLQCPSTDVKQFLGIPFAKPPVGHLRFAAPQPFNQSYGIRDATKAPPSCQQFNAIGGESEPWSEDCLYINIWTPPTASAASNLPVKVFLHGGANVAGGISNPLWGGCFSATDIVQVNIAYRLGPLGFLALESLGGLSGNQGIQDQILGLQWVKDNIAAFGGNPDKIMLFGESAGAFDAWIIATLPQSTDLIHSAVMESGGLLVPQTVDSIRTVTGDFVSRLGCSVDDLSCVQTAPLDKINSSYWATIGAVWPLGAVLDGKLISEQPLSAGVKVPSIIGSNANEGTLFFTPPYAPNEPWNITENDYHDYVDRMYGLASQRVKDAYPRENFADELGPVFSALTSIITHSMFRCTARRVLDSAVKNNVPVWTYSFGHTITCPFMSPIEHKYLEYLAASHASELPFIFGVVDNLPPLGGTCDLSENERTLSADVMDKWRHMASEANPGSNWPMYDPRESKGMNIEGNEIKIGTVDYSMCEFWDSLETGIVQETR
jgi:carboxylesterase type B